MKKTNYYFYNQATKEKNRKNNENDKQFTSNKQYIYDYKRNYFQLPYSATYNENEIIVNFPKRNIPNKKLESSEINKINISEHLNHKYFYSTMNINNIPLNNKEISQKKAVINNSISSYNNCQKKTNYQRCNSIAYIKKRPNDLIKSQNSNNNSMTNNKFLRNSYKMKGRCLSCSNIKLSNNIVEKDFDNSSKKLFLPLSYTFMPKTEIKERTIKKFSTQYQNELLNGNHFCQIIFKVIKHNLLSNKRIFFKNIKSTKSALMYEVSSEEYKFLEELKALGVTNKKELNSLLKDIYISIKGNEK